MTKLKTITGLNICHEQLVCDYKEDLKKLQDKKYIEVDELIKRLREFTENCDAINCIRCRFFLEILKELEAKK